MAFIDAKTVLKKYGIRITQFLLLIRCDRISLYSGYQEKLGQLLYFDTSVNECIKREVYAWILQYESYIVAPQHKIDFRELILFKYNSYYDIEYKYLRFIEKCHGIDISIQQMRKQFYNWYCFNVLSQYLYSDQEIIEALQVELPNFYAHYCEQPDTPFFIPTEELIKKYDHIGEFYLYDIIKKDLVTIYDYYGENLGGIARFERIIYEMNLNPLYAISQYVSFERLQIESFLAKEFPSLCSAPPLFDDIPPKSMPNERNSKKRQTTTQEKAAKLCGVSASTIRNWEKGIRCPESYPGRSSLTALIVWGQGYQDEKKLTSTARKIEKASPVDPFKIDSSDHENVWSDNEE